VTVSVVVPTFNRATLLRRTLQSLVAQTLPADQFEILIIDNRSADATKTVVEDFIARHPGHRVRYVYEGEPGLLAGRHRGTSEALGELLVFIDNDVTTAPDWLRTISDSFRDPAVHIVGGPLLPDYEVDPPEWLNAMWTPEQNGRSLGYLSLIDLGNRPHWISPLFVWGANLSIRKHTLLALKGFHPDQVPDGLQYLRGDGEIGLALKSSQAGYKALYHPQARVMHYVSAQRMTTEYFEHRFFCQGVADSYTRIRRRARMGLGGPRQRIRYALATLKGQVLETIGPRAARFLRLPGGVAAQGRRLERPSRLAGEEWGRASDIGMLWERFWQAYARGVEFHRSAVREAPGLLEWVVKDDYWDYRVPQISWHRER
jgi:glucosyl-dolichyl phosphate glucuronosyltransferase